MKKLVNKYLFHDNTLTFVHGVLVALGFDGLQSVRDRQERILR